MSGCGSITIQLNAKNQTKCKWGPGEEISCPHACMYIMYAYTCMFLKLHVGISSVCCQGCSINFSRLYTISGPDWWTELLDWTTGLTDFHHKHTGRLSMGPEQHEARL